MFRFTLNLHHQTRIIYISNSLIFNDERHFIDQAGDITSSQCWLSTYQFDRIHFKNTVPIIYQQNGLRPYTIDGKLAQIDFTFGLDFTDTEFISLKNYNVILNNDRNLPIPYHSAFGLSRTFKDSDQDIISYLYDKGLITQKLFSLTYIEKDKAILNLGNYADGVTEYHEFVMNIGLKKTDEKWRVDLTAIFIGNLGNNKIKGSDSTSDQYIINNSDIYEVNESGYFSTIEKYIVIPFSYLNLLYKNYFWDLGCVGENNGAIRKIICIKNKNNEIFNKGEQINFVFNKVNVLYFTGYDLFEEVGNKGEFCMVSYNDNNEWVFGYYFGKRFYFIFSQDHGISVFSLSNKAYVKLVKTNKLISIDDLNYVKIYFLCSILLCLIGININIVIKYKGGSVMSEKQKKEVIEVGSH